MLLKENPWKDMETPVPPAFSTRPVNSDSKHNFMWIKDGSGRPGLALSFDEAVTGRFEVPVFQNLEISVQSDKKTVTFLLKDESALRQFRIFCEDCVDAVEEHAKGDAPSVLATLAVVVIKWVELFDGRNRRHLSKSAEIGLIGELIVMRDILVDAIGASDSVLAWNGPKGHEQDFLYNSSLIEVKCQLASKDKVFNISSLEQLDSVSGQIYLSHVGISPAATGLENCFSLPSLVDEIIAQLSSDNYAIDTFLGCLELVGYSHGDDKRFDSYVESFLNIFKVDESFPRITRPNIHSAIEKCSYRLNATMLGHWQVSKSQVLEEIVT